MRPAVGGSLRATPSEVSQEACSDRRPLVLASRSPRRLELLSRLVPADRIRVLPPASADEAGFDGLTTLAAIEERLRGIAAAKGDDAAGRIDGDAVVIAADTVIVAGAEGDRVVLGQPPEPDWADAVRTWFADRLAGRTHLALTALCVIADGVRRETVTTTRVTFRADAAALVDWYVSTGEPRGKAGGYAIQGLGSVFVERLEGSLTNVVGLPLETLLGLLRDVDAARRLACPRTER